MQPCGPFAAVAYERLRAFLRQQIEEGVEIVSIPGYLDGKVVLSSGQTVPVVVPELRGLYSWKEHELVKSVLGPEPKTGDERGKYRKRATEIGNFLERVYYELRNLGLASEERALNFAATNAFQVEQIFKQALDGGLSLDSIDVVRSPICRPGSDCWDVKLTFFNPLKRIEQARHVFRFGVDVSDVIPVTVGTVRQWDVY